ncbi:cupin domain-containing protein [Halovenus sp. WSH3]|uniref:Cupin domain-containing protein n=1 Tax=Halovenus carboxidivorans TaxID=2692199 RepID=A0A6B0TA44_9EURY|nr:cupin domain-containing protein [Halovenus carboxidivorans]MXR52111.1 cupin domain-containing protein [Halovenus carboxidivorans]
MADSEYTYHCIDPEELPSTPEYPCDRRSVSDDADLGLLAAAVYELAPGEQLPRSYHYHEQREELFSVREGQLTVETPDGEYEVEAGELFVAHPESPHRAYNPDTADEPVVVLGVGAPSTDIAHPYDPDE